MTLGVLFVFSVFGAQLLRLQGFDAAATSAQALSSRTTRETVPALRGRILDSQGVVLAESLERRTVTVDQTAVPEYTKKGVKVGVAAAAADLAPLLGTTAATLTPELTGKARYRVVARDISPLNWRKINTLGIPGIYSERTASRTYPMSTAVASLVGFVTQDGAPGGGLEYLMRDQLAGRDGEEVFQRSQDGRAIATAPQETRPAVPGKDVRLSISSDLQWYAQNVLARKVNETQALSGTVVVEDVHTGKLLAVASYPTYDPNNLAKATGNLTNLAFTDVFEPGSTGKVITAAAALQEGKATPSTPVVVPGRLHRSDAWFKDAEPHGTENLTFAGVLAQSSNIGTMLVGEKVDPATMDSYFHKFGLGSRSGISFPGESPGILVPHQQWSGTQRYTVLFGQGLSVNAIQVAGVYQTIANDGLRVPPRLVDSVSDGNGGLTTPSPPAGVRVVSPQVAEQVRTMLEGVVSKDGTAPEARIEGYRVAGKTGTADRYDEKTKGYSGKTASFIGFAPADKPQVVVAVILQRPVKGYFGGTVAAPVFKDVMTYALQELKIPPTGTKPKPIKLKLDAPPVAADPTVVRDTRSPGGG